MTDEQPPDTPTPTPDDSGGDPIDLPEPDMLPEDLTPSTDIKEGRPGTVETTTLDTTDSNDPQ